MSKKKPIKKIFENAPIEPADGHDELVGSVQPEALGEETSLETNPQEESEELSSQDEASSDETSQMSDEANNEITESLPADVQNEEISSDDDSRHIENA